MLTARSSRLSLLVSVLCIAAAPAIASRVDARSPEPSADSLKIQTVDSVRTDRVAAPRPELSMSTVLALNSFDLAPTTIRATRTSTARADWTITYNGSRRLVCCDNGANCTSFYTGCCGVGDPCTPLGSWQDSRDQSGRSRST